MQKISLDDSRELVKQIQASHRMLVGFYQRILPLLDEVADEIGLSFSAWEPLDTELPRKNNQPSESWSWDYVPLFCSEHGYERVHDANETHPSDVYLALFLMMDENFQFSQRKALGLFRNQEPDAVTLAEGRALLRAVIFRPTRASKEKFFELFKNTNMYVDFSIGKRRLSDDLWCEGHEWLLEDFLCNTDMVVAKLNASVNAT